MLKTSVLTSLLLWAPLLYSQDVTTVKYNQLQTIIDDSNSDLTIVNFWATWCGPCIKEMPHFEAVNQNDDVTVYFVSLDFPDELPKVSKIIEKKSLKARVLWLDETDYDSYMRKVSESWSGAIPATLMVKRDGEKHFFEQAFSGQELASTVNLLLKKS